MDQKQIDSLREKVKAALPAPWVYEVVEAGEWIRSIAAASHNDQADIVCGELRAEWSPEWQCLPSDENASLIVSAINALPDLLTLAEQALSPIGDGEVAEVVQALQSIRGEQELKDVGWFGVMSKAANLLTRLSSQLHQARSELERTADARSRADFAYDNAIKSARADHKAHARRLFRRSGSRNRAAGTRHAAS